jgi:hypothetical protein
MVFDLQGAGWKHCADICLRVEDCKYYTVGNGKCQLKGADAKKKKMKNNPKKVSGSCPLGKHLLEETLAPTPAPTPEPTPAPATPAPGARTNAPGFGCFMSQSVRDAGYTDGKCDCSMTEEECLAEPSAPGFGAPIFTNACIGIDVCLEPTPATPAPTPSPTIPTIPFPNPAYPRSCKMQKCKKAFKKNGQKETCRLRDCQGCEHKSLGKKFRSCENYQLQYQRVRHRVHVHWDSCQFSSGTAR